MMNAEGLSVVTLFAYVYLAGYAVAITLASPTGKQMVSSCLEVSRALLKG